MRATSNVIFALLAVGILVAATSTARAGVSVRFGYHYDPADIRVWIESGHDRYGYDHVHYDDYDVYESANELVLCVRASRSTYATVYVVDAHGFVHVVHPLTSHRHGRLTGGRVYKIHLGDFGFRGFGRGVAYAFAVSSPRPFDYTVYGSDIFGRGYGYQIHGDPYVASRHFYFSLIGSCEPQWIRVSHARFYIGEYVRYPRYLCVGWHDYYGSRRYCSSDCTAFRYYRVHARDPYRVLHPTHRIKQDVSEYGRVTASRERGVRPQVDRTVNKKTQASSRVTRSTRTKTNGLVSAKSTTKQPKTKRTNVVRSSNASFAKSKTAARKVTTKRAHTKTSRGESKSKRGSSGKVASGQR